MLFWQINKIEVLDTVPDSMIPIRVALVTEAGIQHVVAGGQSLAEAVITLFSTGGFGRLAPKVLAKKLKQKYEHWQKDESLCQIIVALSEVKPLISFN